MGSKAQALVSPPIAFPGCSSCLKTDHREAVGKLCGIKGFLCLRKELPMNLYGNQIFVACVGGFWAPPASSAVTAACFQDQ